MDCKLVLSWEDLAAVVATVVVLVDLELVLLWEESVAVVAMVDVTVV